MDWNWILNRHYNFPQLNILSRSYWCCVDFVRIALFLCQRWTNFGNIISNNCFSLWNYCIMSVSEGNFDSVYLLYNFVPMMWRMLSQLIKNHLIHLWVNALIWKRNFSVFDLFFSLIWCTCALTKSCFLWFDLI